MKTQHAPTMHKDRTATHDRTDHAPLVPAGFLIKMTWSYVAATERKEFQLADACRSELWETLRVRVPEEGDNAPGVEIVSQSYAVPGKVWQEDCFDGKRPAASVFCWLVVKAPTLEEALKLRLICADGSPKDSNAHWESMGYELTPATL